MPKCLIFQYGYSVSVCDVLLQSTNLKQTMKQENNNYLLVKCFSIPSTYIQPSQKFTEVRSGKCQVLDC